MRTYCPVAKSDKSGKILSNLFTYHSYFQLDEAKKILDKWTKHYGCIYDAAIDVFDNDEKIETINFGDMNIS